MGVEVLVLVAAGVPGPLVGRGVVVEVGVKVGRGVGVLVGMEVETRATGLRSSKLVKRQAWRKASNPAIPAPLIKCLLSIYNFEFTDYLCDLLKS